MKIKIKGIEREKRRLRKIRNKYMRGNGSQCYYDLTKHVMKVVRKREKKK